MRVSRIPFAFLIVGLALSGALHAEPAISPSPPEAESKVAGDFEFELLHGDKPIRVFGYRPAGWKEGPLLVLFHGANRDAAGYRKSGRVLADKLGMLLVVLEFDRMRFDPEAYQEGGVFLKKKQQPAEARTFACLPSLLAEMNRREGRELSYYLAGHSAGAQFICRMAALYPNHAKRMVAVNPGSLVFPNRDGIYPHGFGGLLGDESSDEAIKRYLAVPLTLYLGTGDVALKYLDTGKAAMKQGATRIERGRNAYAAARKLAEEKGWPFHWTLVEAEGLEHGCGPMWSHPRCQEAFLGN
ncbi:hypothetical protein KBB96_05825 [Luteolibacter ambystomatis]|uniref:Alpha/beta hydrolase n=1 Tax=Luteolibacter ambystomatis TaxID=2824561 RepID=A0A975J1P1_9BACT|nr:hypothetical protein [Luteolibacter ambystomatis]QUE52408.1 hypothetical protein KBB96_05825 [Luteolibacter ambystomatis]